MTTPPVVSITDELIAELEAAANETGGIEWHASTAYCSKSERESRAIYHRPSPSVCVEIIETPDSDPENGESIHAEEYWKYLGLANPATILALLAERADLKLQLAAASVDAERYDWLREMHNDEYGCLWVSHWDYGQVAWVSLDAFYRPGYDGELDLDAAIDAARNIGSGD